MFLFFVLSFSISLFYIPTFVVYIYFPYTFRLLRCCCSWIWREAGRGGGVGGGRGNPMQLRIILSSPSVYGMYVHMYEEGLRWKSLVLFSFFFFSSPFSPRRYVNINSALHIRQIFANSTLQVGDGYGWWSMGKSKKQTKPSLPLLLFPPNMGENGVSM